MRAEPRSVESTLILTLFATSMVTLGLEVVLTRIFAVVLFSSHAFIAISIAFLGGGAGALIAHFLRPVDKEQQSRQLLWLLPVMAFVLVLSLWLILQVEFVPQEISDESADSHSTRLRHFTRNPDEFQLWKLLAVMPLSLLPFLFAGYVQGCVFRVLPERFGRLYGIDLIAATIGAICIPLLLYPFGLLGTIGAVVVITLVPLVYATFQRTVKPWQTVVAFSAPLALLVGLIASGTFDIQYAAGFSEKNAVRTHWSHLARVSLMNIDDKDVYIVDNSSRTWYAPKTKRNIRRYDRALFTIPFSLKSEGEVLIIASGGGQEVTMASHYGMTSIDAVEIAGPIIRDILEERADEPGNPYLLPNVNPIIADGRSFSQRVDKRYDVIQMLEVNLHTLASQINQAWSHYFIFTQEAYFEYLKKLKDDGYLCYTTYSSKERALIRGYKRRFASMIAGMRMAGIERPQDHIVILTRPYAEGYRMMVMIKKTPYEQDEIASILHGAQDKTERFDKTYRVLFPNVSEIVEAEDLPDRIVYRSMNKHEKLAERVSQLIEDSRPVVGFWGSLKATDRSHAPITDDRPYKESSGLFDKVTEFGTLIGDMYRALILIMGLLIAIFVLTPFAIQWTRGEERPAGVDFRAIAILVFTGFGFMFIEMAAIYRYQLYLHHPTTAMIVVLSSMLLGAGLGSLHSSRIPPDRRESRILSYSASALAFAMLVLVVGPIFAHDVLLALPTVILIPVIFSSSAALGYLLGHVVPLSISSYVDEDPRVMAFIRAINITGSTYGVVAASILSRELGMSFVTVLGAGCYLGVAFTVIASLRFMGATAKSA